ncbi:MAG: ATP synthase subunit I [Symploca sp. SIO2E6]|nr:ATP synthase subunit I [Symploca sp. SIO2E6]
MNLSNDSLEPTTAEEELPQNSSPPTTNNSSMAEFYRLKQNLLLATLVLAGIIFIPVWIVYSLNTALNYLLGAFVSMVYLRMLAKDVERLGQQNQRLSSNRFALLAGLIIFASQWQNLHIMPIFLGFLTYKAAILVYLLPSTLMPTSK